MFPFPKSKTKESTSSDIEELITAETLQPPYKRAVKKWFRRYDDPTKKIIILAYKGMDHEGKTYHGGHAFPVYDFIRIFGKKVDIIHDQTLFTWKQEKEWEDRKIADKIEKNIKNHWLVDSQGNYFIRKKGQMIKGTPSEEDSKAVRNFQRARENMGWVYYRETPSPELFHLVIKGSFKWQL
jgi:hypothetical protein